MKEDIQIQSGHACACGHAASEELPELVVATIPHEVRHAAIFGALGGLAPGKGLVIVANHDPIPLLTQLEQRAPDQYAVEYRERGPETYRVAIVRA